MEKAEVASALTQVVSKKKPGRPKKNTNTNTIQISGVVPAPVNPNHVLEMTYNNSLCLRKIISLYRSYSCSNIFITFRKDSMHWFSVDHMEKVNCYVDIDCHNIFRYFCQTPVTYSIPRANIELVFNILKKAISDVSIIIEKDNTSQLIFVITDSEYDTTEKFEVNGVIANEYAVIPKPDITTYPIEFKISSKQFKDRMSNVNKFETQVIAIQKYQNEPLQIVCNDYRVAWSGSFNNDEKINFKSKLKENETFVVSVNKENLYCLSNNNLGNDFLVTADHTKKLSFSTVLDERINNPTVVVSVFIDIIGGRA